MAKEIYVKGNYLFIDDTVLPIHRYPSIMSHFIKTATKWVITNTATLGSVPILISDVANWYNEAGDTAYSEATMDTLLEGGTGGANS